MKIVSNNNIDNFTATEAIIEKADDLRYFCRFCMHYSTNAEDGGFRAGNELKYKKEKNAFALNIVPLNYPASTGCTAMGVIEFVDENEFLPDPFATSNEIFEKISYPESVFICDEWSPSLFCYKVKNSVDFENP